MALRDTSWIWDTTSGSPKTANAIITGKSGGPEQSTSGGTTVTRTKTVTNYEWVGLTKSAALAFDSKMSADTSNTTKTWNITEKNRVVGEYGATMVVTTITGWS